MTTRGFLLGKFLPPHAGHVFMCNTASHLCDELTILVCSLDRESIEGQLRYGWMKSLFPHARVIHFTQDVPQEPKDHPDFWKIWQKICQEAHPEKLDYVFGSEPYVIKLAEVMAAKPVVIDPERLAFPVSGTAVRENPYAHWDMVPGPVRPYYQRRVVLVGAESTGKSTLTKHLADHLKTRYVPEYGRTYDAYRIGDWQAKSFEEIEAGHRAMRQAIAPSAGPILIEDTDELLTRVWEEALTGQRPTRPRPADIANLYLLLDTDLSWHDDGTRYQQDISFRSDFQQAVKRELEEANTIWRTVSGVGQDRLTNALAILKDIFGQDLL
ncbi:MAG: AAA family ATPase [Agrobacterium vaccinii]